MSIGPGRQPSATRAAMAGFSSRWRCIWVARGLPWRLRATPKTLSSCVGFFMKAARPATIRSDCRRRLRLKSMGKAADGMVVQSEGPAQRAMTLWRPAALAAYMFR